MSSILKLWDTGSKEKIIELMVMMQCPADIVIDSIIESDKMNEISQFYDGYKKKKNANVILNYHIA
jgi:hypothetical protein